MPFKPDVPVWCVMVPVAKVSEKDKIYIRTRDGLVSPAMPRERAGASKQARLIFDVMDSQRSRRGRAGNVEGYNFWYLRPWIVAKWIVPDPETSRPRAILARFPRRALPRKSGHESPLGGFVEAAAHDAGLVISRSSIEQLLGLVRDLLNKGTPE